MNFTNDIENSLWVAKYAPKKIDDLVLEDGLKNKLKQFIETKEIPNLGFFGPQGTGKTSTGKVLLNELGVQKSDILFLNASDINSVDAVREIIKPFAMSMSSNPDLPLRFIFLDEADYLTPNAQSVLRNLIESSYKSARFILTANYPKKIIPALHSRLQVFQLERPNINQIVERILKILKKEKVEIKDEDGLVELVRNTFPDIRKTIQTLQQNIFINDETGRKYFKYINSSSNSNSTLEEYLKLFKQSDIKALRNYVYKNFTDGDANEFWSFMIEKIIENQKDFEDLGDGLDSIIYQLNEGQKNHEFVANKLLNIIGFTIAALLPTKE